LTTLFSDTAISTAAPIDAPLPHKKRGWLPLLTILFCISYGLMTMLIVEQGSTIESQRALIRELFRDSSELTATKMKALNDKRAAAPSAKAQNQTPWTQDPSTQDPSTQDHSNQTPSSQAAPQHGRQNPAQKAKPQFQMPSRPASDLADDRRALITI
jgi:hypothetical protein